MKKKLRLKCGHFNLKAGCLHCVSIFKEWNQKLDESAMEGESFSLEEKSLNVSLLEKDLPADIPGITATYYAKLSQKYDLEKFTSEIDRLIMWRRSSGDKICEIVQLLIKKRKRLHRETVRHIIRRYEAKWGLRKWTCKQMNLKPRTK